MKNIISILIFIIIIIFIYNIVDKDDFNKCDLSTNDTIKFVNKSLNAILYKYFDIKNQNKNTSKQKIFIYKNHHINLFLKNKKCELIFLDKKVNDSISVFDINDLSCKNDTINVIFEIYGDEFLPKSLFVVKFEKNKNELIDCTKWEY